MVLQDLVVCEDCGGKIWLSPRFEPSATCEMLIGLGEVIMCAATSLFYIGQKGVAKYQ